MDSYKSPNFNYAPSEENEASVESDKTPSLRCFVSKYSQSSSPRAFKRGICAQNKSAVDWQLGSNARYSGAGPLLVRGSPGVQDWSRQRFHHLCLFGANLLCEGHENLSMSAQNHREETKETGDRSRPIRRFAGLRHNAQLCLCCVCSSSLLVASSKGVPS